MDSITLSLLAVLFTILTYLWYQAYKSHKFFEYKEIPYVKPWYFLGNGESILFMRNSLAESQRDICQQFPNEPVVGYFQFTKPVYLTQDPQLVEKILIKDFLHFMDRGFPVNEKRNPLDSNLFAMTGKRWKACRNKMSPIFTTGKLRMMYDAMLPSGDELVKQLDGQDEVDMREVIGRFSMDVIGSCAFGMEFGILDKPDCEFRRMGKKGFEMDKWRFMKLAILFTFPSVAQLFNLTINPPDVTEYFCNIIRDTVKYRRDNNYVRNDFLQLMMQLQDKGYVEIHTKDPADDYLNIDHNSYSTEKFEMTNEQLTGQAFNFLTTSFETIAVGATYTLYELSKHSEIQEKVRAEILREVNKIGSLSYDAIKAMTYLEQCVNEGMRKYPVIPGLMRVCTKEYTLPKGQKVSAGELIFISVLAMHFNPKYYPEPDQYKPERFDPDRTIPTCTYLPFGNGPRMCIAMRFAMMELKYCLAKLLMNYRCTVSPKTMDPLKYDEKSFFAAPKEPILFNVEKIT